MDDPGSHVNGDRFLGGIESAYSNCSSDAQALLACLAPFTSLRQSVLKPYTVCLQRQSALAELPYHRWPEVWTEACSGGMLFPHPVVPGYHRLDPAFRDFLASRLRLPDYAERCRAIQIAFLCCYDLVSASMFVALKSKNSEERQRANLAMAAEGENIATALRLALDARVTCARPFGALSAYLAANKEHQRGVELAESVLARMERLPAEGRQGWMLLELAGVIYELANHQYYLRRDRAAEANYQKALAILLESELSGPPLVRKVLGETYRDLGNAAYEQRRFRQAEESFQKALAIQVELADRCSQGVTYFALGRTAARQRKWRQSKDCYRKAMQIHVEFNDLAAQGQVYHALGAAAERQGRCRRAKQYYRKALEISTQVGDRQEQAVTYSALGALAQEANQWARARRYYRQALKTFLETGDRYYQALTFQNLGTLARAQCHRKLARRYYHAAARILKEFENPHDQALSHFRLGDFALEQCQWERARGYLVRALRIFAEEEDEDRLELVLQSLADLWETSRDVRLLALVGKVLRKPPQKVKSLFRRILREGNDL